MKTEDFEHLSYEVRDHVAIVCLNRPDRGNAWTGHMAVEYRWALHHADQDTEVSVVLVTGAGDTFCVGADSDILQTMDAEGGAYTRKKADLPPYPTNASAGMRHNHTYPLSLSVPVVTAINGACAGAGFVLACFADIRLAVDGTKITPSYAGLGLPAEYGIAWILTRIVGRQRAADILFSNAVMSTDDAVKAGFVLRSWPREEFAERAFDYAREMAERSSPESLGVMKRQLHDDAELDLHEAYGRAVSDMNRMVGLPDFSEGVRALREKRRPIFFPRRSSVNPSA